MVQGGRRPVPCNGSGDPTPRFSSSARMDNRRLSLPSRAPPPAPYCRHRLRRPSCPRPTRRIGYTGHPLEARLDRAGAGGAGHVLNREGDCLFGGESGRCGENTDDYGNRDGKFGHRELHSRVEKCAVGTPPQGVQCEEQQPGSSVAVDVAGSPFARSL